MLRATSFFPSRSASRLLLAVTISNLALPTAAEACTCELVPVAETFDFADAVFLGEVLSLRNENLPAAFANHISVTLRVLQSWKGVTGELVGLVTDSSEAACGSTFEVGEQRLVYATSGGGTAHPISPGTLVTNFCVRCADVFPCVASEEIEEIENLGHEPLTLTPGPDPLYPPIPSIPAVSTWGLASLSMLLLVAGTIAIRRAKNSFGLVARSIQARP